MRRLALAGAVLATVATLGVTGGLSGMASAATLHVKPGTTWTTEIHTQGCEIETISGSNIFFSDLANAGTYTGGARSLHMTWTVGNIEGLTFSGKWHKTTKSYVGTFGGIFNGTGQLVKGAVSSFEGLAC